MILALVLAACGGGSPPDTPPTQPPDLALSPGGHWFAMQDGARSSFYISETGTVRAIVETAPATVPLIGGGTTYRFVLTGSSDDGFAAVFTVYIPT